MRNEDPDSTALHVLVITTSVGSGETKLPEGTHEAITADRAKPRHSGRDSRVNVDVDAIDHRKGMPQVVTQCDPAFQDGAQLLAACL
jgi:soluble cytochrome b562